MDSSSKLTVYFAGYDTTSIDTYIAALKRHKIGTVIDCRSSPNPSKRAEFKLKNVSKMCQENGIKYSWKGEKFGGKHQQKKLLQTLCNNEARVAEDFLCCIFSVVKQPSLILCECANIQHCHCRHIADALLLYDIANIKTISIPNEDANAAKCESYALSQDTKIKIIGYHPQKARAQKRRNQEDEEKQPVARTDWSKYLKSMEEQDLKAVLAQFEEKWKKEQLELKQKLILTDDFNFYLPTEKEQALNVDDIFKTTKLSEKKKVKLQYVAGVDISHGAEDEDLACAGLVVLEYPSLQKVYEKFSVVRFTQPYIAGFLAFREVDFLVTIIEEIKSDHPEYLPQVILVDGNGILHHRGFGLACHLGVLTGIPCIGVAKNILVVDGLDKDRIKQECDEKLLKRGDYVDLIGQTRGKIGVALRCSEKGKTPVYVSNGYKISLQSGIEIVMATSAIYRQPEPIRAVDGGTRKAIMEHERKLKQINK